MYRDIAYNFALVNQSVQRSAVGAVLAESLCQRVKIFTHEGFCLSMLFFFIIKKMVLEKLQRSGVQLSERFAGLGIRGALRAALKQLKHSDTIVLRGSRASIVPRAASLSNIYTIVVDFPFWNCVKLF